MQNRPNADLGVPKHGDPDCISTFERKDPNTTGQPANELSEEAIPVNASASCWARAAGTVTGDMAPININGVKTTGWFALLYSNCASSIRSSQRNGELQLISEIVAGICSTRSRPPKRIAVMARVSAALTAETTFPMYTLSLRVCSA